MELFPAAGPFLPSQRQRGSFKVDHHNSIDPRIEQHSPGPHILIEHSLPTSFIKQVHHTIPQEPDLPFDGLYKVRIIPSPWETLQTYTYVRWS